MTCTPHHHVWPPASDLCRCGGWEALGARGMRAVGPNTSPFALSGPPQRFDAEVSPADDQGATGRSMQTDGTCITDAPAPTLQHTTRSE